ncbi:MAG: hypothetical protein MUQ10_08765 [Anaerolineae bacterium]|nr:hypothetical protein [Anaerolineae bacterium]
MAIIRVPVGSVKIVDGFEVDRTEIVEIDGSVLATRAKVIAEDGTRGFRETLYYTTDRRLLVHLEDWSVRRRHGTIYTLTEVTRRDLQKDGKFEELAVSAWAWLR